MRRLLLTVLLLGCSLPPGKDFYVDLDTDGGNDMLDSDAMDDPDSGISDTEGTNGTDEHDTSTSEEDTESDIEDTDSDTDSESGTDDFDSDTGGVVDSGNEDTDSNTDTATDPIDSDTDSVDPGDTESDSDTDTDTGDAGDTDTGTDSEPDTSSDTESDTDTETDTESGSDSDSDSDVDSDTDTDSGGDTDTDSDTDTETDTGVGETWVDSLGLMWEMNPPFRGDTYQEATLYCQGLILGDHDDWRLPTIFEYYTFIRGCDAAFSDGCVLTEDCYTADCMEVDAFFCRCALNRGPNGGCYTPDEIPSTCGPYVFPDPVQRRWTSTPFGSGEYMWTFRENTGGLEAYHELFSTQVGMRCVR